jgi:hypothetical protein
MAMIEHQSRMVMVMKTWPWHRAQILRVEMGVSWAGGSGYGVKSGLGGHERSFWCVSGAMEDNNCSSKGKVCSTKDEV